MESAIEGATTKQYTRLTKERSPTGYAAPWGFNSPKENISSVLIDEDIEKYLFKNVNLLKVIKNYCSDGAFAAVHLLCEYQDLKNIRGFHLTSKVISLLRDYKLEFGFDVVTLLSD